jgi:hypothetical protein
MLGSEELDSSECGRQRVPAIEEPESRECWEVRSWRAENAGK